MATYSIKAPDGRTIQIKARDEATAIRGAQEWTAANPIQEPGNVTQPSQAYTDALAAGSAASRKLGVPSSEQPQPGPDLMGSIATTLAGINTVPVVGPLLQNTSDALIGTGAQLTGGNYGETVKGLQDRRAELARANPVANLAGSIAANLGAFGIAGAPRAVAQGLSPAALTLAGGETVGSSALGLTGSTAARIGNGLASTAGLTTADNMLQGQAPVEALTNAAIPTLVGGAIPAVGGAIRSGADAVADASTRAAQRKLTDQAVKGAPDAKDLKSVASGLFKKVDESGTAIKTDYLAQRVYQAAQKAEKELIDSELDAPAMRLYNIVADRIRQAYDSGTGIPLGMLHNMRQIAQDIVVKGGGDRTGRFADQIVDLIDDIAGNLKPSQLQMPANRLGNANNAGNALLEGISTWGRARRVDLIEEALYKAQNQASGVENGLRTQFRALLQNKKTRNLFSAAEREAIEKVANGTSLSNLTRLLGTFGFELGSGRNAIGGALGLLAGGPVGAIVGTGSRKLAENMAIKAGQRAANVVATPNIPTAVAKQVPQGLIQGLTAAEIAGKGLLLGNN